MHLCSVWRFVSLRVRLCAYVFTFACVSYSPNPENGEGGADLLSVLLSGQIFSGGFSSSQMDLYHLAHPSPL